MEVEPSLEVVVGGAGEPGRDVFEEEGELGSTRELGGRDDGGDDELAGRDRAGVAWGAVAGGAVARVGGGSERGMAETGYGA